MTTKVLLIDRDKLSEEDLQTKHLAELKLMADYDFTMPEFAEKLNAHINFSNQFLVYPYEVMEDEITLEQDGSHDIIVNKQLEVHIGKSDVGYYVDLFRYATDEELSQDDYDMDADFISGCTAWEDDFIKD